MWRSSFLIVLLLVCSGCGSTRWSRWCSCDPGSGKNSEALAGARAAPALEARFGGVADAPEIEARLRRVACRIAAAAGYDGPLCCRLLRCDGRNAASLPGGRIYITRGLYEVLHEDDLLAAVIAHELAHVMERDHFKPRCNSPAAALAREERADALAVGYLQEAGIRPTAMADVVELIRRQQPGGWAEARIENVRQLAAAADNLLASSR